MKNEEEFSEGIDTEAPVKNDEEFTEGINSNCPGGAHDEHECQVYCDLPCRFSSV